MRATNCESLSDDFVAFAHVRSRARDNTHMQDFSTRDNGMCVLPARASTRAWPRASHLFTYVSVARR